MIYFANTYFFSVCTSHTNRQESLFLANDFTNIELDPADLLVNPEDALIGSGQEIDLAPGQKYVMSRTRLGNKFTVVKLEVEVTGSNRAVLVNRQKRPWNINRQEVSCLLLHQLIFCEKFMSKHY